MIKPPIRTMGITFGKVAALLALATTVVSFNAQAITGVSNISLGSTVASAGDIRGTSTFTIKARNAANTSDLNVHTIDGANGHTIGGSTNSASITSGVITGGFHAWQVNAAEVARFDSTQLLLTVGGVNFAASVTPVITQAVATSGAGKTALIRAQQGFAGSIGGILQLGGGDGGTPGTNLGGATQVLLGTVNGSSVSALFSLCTGTAASPTSILDISQNAAVSTTLNAPGNFLNLRVTGVNIAILSSGSFNLFNGVIVFGPCTKTNSSAAGATTTTDGTTGVAVTALDWTPTSGAGYRFKYVFVGKNAANNAVQISVEGCCESPGGVAAISGTNAAQTSTGTAALLASVCTITIVGGKVRATITGVAATTITWNVYYENWKV